MLTGWASLGMRTLDMAIVLPVVLNRFTAAEIALWGLFLSVLALQAMVESGFSATFVRVFAYAMGGAETLDVAAGSHRREPRERGGQPNVELMRAIWRALCRQYAILSGGIFLLTLLGGSIAMKRPIDAAPDSASAWWAWLVLVGTGPIVIQGNIYTVFLQGINRVALFRRWEAASVLVGAVLSGLVVFYRGELIHLVVLRQSWALLTVLINRRLCRQTPEFRSLADTATTRDGEVLSVVRPKAWRSSLGIALSAGLIEMSGVVYAQLGPAETVASYLVALRLLQSLRLLSGVPFYSQLPLLARLYSEGRIEHQLKLARKGMAWSYWSFVVVFVALGLWAEPLLTAIGSNAGFVPPSLWLLLGLGFFAERYGAMHLQLFSTTNVINWHVVAGTSGLIYTVMAVAMFHVAGLYAFPLAMLAGQLGFYSWYSARCSYREFGLRFWSFERRAAVPPFLVMLSYAVYCCR